MKALKVEVRDGRIVGEAPPGFPEGEVELCRADPGDGMTEQEREELHAALKAGWQAIQKGRFRSARDFLEELRSRL